MAHDRSFVGRREVLGLFVTSVLAGNRLNAQEQELQFSGLDHFEFYVSNVERSRDFFVRLFGNTLLSRNNKRYLKLGSTYMAFEAPRGGAAGGQVDHVSLAIKNLEMAKLHDFLQQRGVMYQDYPSGRDTAVLDPDGIRLQLSPENGWSLLNPATFLPERVELAEEPVFRPAGLDHVVFNVSELQKSVAHYQKFLGTPTRQGNDTVSFQVGTSRILLSLTPAGQRPGVRYLSIRAEYFDANAKSRQLQQMGIRTMPSDSQSTVRFQDPDGLLHQVQSLSRL
jgi:catechol 2,3-dioxygenase-like lactoylglutathione lyase family enzyme